MSPWPSCVDTRSSCARNRQMSRMYSTRPLWHDRRNGVSPALEKWSIEGTAPFSRSHSAIWEQAGARQEGTWGGGLVTVRRGGRAHVVIRKYDGPVQRSDAFTVRGVDRIGRPLFRMDELHELKLTELARLQHRGHAPRTWSRGVRVVSVGDRGAPRAKQTQSSRAGARVEL